MSSALKSAPNPRVNLAEKQALGLMNISEDVRWMRVRATDVREGERTSATHISIHTFHTSFEDFVYTGVVFLSNR